MFSRAMQEMHADAAALERIFGGIDSSYCMSVMHRLFARDTELGRLMTTRLLRSIYECDPEVLYVQGLSREMRWRHYAKQIEWMAETCKYYAEGAKAVAEVEERAIVMREWRRWERALAEEWYIETAAEGCPETAQELRCELLEVMRPGLPEDARVEYRRRMAERWAFLHSHDGACVSCADLPGASGLPDAFLGADRVDTQEGWRERPY